MRKVPRWLAPLIAFVLGFSASVGGLWGAIRLQFGPPLPRFWTYWLFDANPFLFVICTVLRRKDLCVGLTFDGGPLEDVELLWLVFAQGAPFGLLAALGTAAFRRRRKSLR